jgi:hypothetical protein
MTQIPNAPLSFNGTLEELYDYWAKHVLLDPVKVEEFHHQFCAYYQEINDPIYLVRKVTELERGRTLRNEAGVQICATDNAPAWWIHYQLYTGQYRQFNTFVSFMEAIPCHMFKINLPDHINHAGWHVAHIFNTKDRNTAYKQWDAVELLRRTVRNIHPCNYFYLPKKDWQSYGGDPSVISFFYEKFKHRYQTIWEDFLRLVDGSPTSMNTNSGVFYYTFTPDYKRERSMPIVNKKISIKSETTLDTIVRLEDCVVTYKFSRLCFNAGMIEPLEMNEKFGIITLEGVFVLSKKEFYEVFENVVKSISYQEKGRYHYPQTPKKAMRFKIEINEQLS